MTAWAFTHAYNEAILIPYWVRHYRTFCDRVIVYLDNDTDDGTGEIAQREGAEVRPFVGGFLDDQAFVDFAQEHYVEARGQAEWVAWTDVDEIIYHPNLVARLAELRASGVTLPNVDGFSMVSDQPPSGQGQIYDEIRRGFPDQNYAKVCIFDPNLDVLWSTGKHTAWVPGSRSDDGTDPLKLLHYRWLGPAWHEARNARNYARMNAINLAKRHGQETWPGYEGPHSVSWYAEQAQRAYECI